MLQVHKNDLFTNYLKLEILPFLPRPYNLQYLVSAFFLDSFWWMRHWMSFERPYF